MKAPDREPVEVEIDDTPACCACRSQFLDIAIPKHGLLLRVRRADGAPLMTDLSEPEPRGRRRVGPPGAARRRVSLAWAPAPIRRSSARQGRARRGPAADLDSGVWRVSPRTWLLPFRFHRARPLPITAPASTTSSTTPHPEGGFEEHNAVRPAAEAWPVRPSPSLVEHAARFAAADVHAAMSAVLAPNSISRPMPTRRRN